MKRRILRALSRLKLFDLDWLDEMRDIAHGARAQRVEDEAVITTDPHDMSRWITTPKGRRKRPHALGERR